MAERVHPRNSSPPTHLDTASNDKLTVQLHDPKPSPPPGTYVIQIPKDQVFRVPPPENARKFHQLSKKKPRRSRCLCCLCSILSILITIILLAAIAAGIFYLVFRPKSVDYSIDNMSIRGINLTSSSSVISPEFDVTVRANNRNKKIGVYYVDGSSVDVYYKDDKFSSGVLPVFYQPSNNVTVFVTVLTEAGIVLTGAERRGLADEQSKEAVPLKVNLKVPIRVKVGSIKTWKITIKVKCDVTVDKLSTEAKILSNDCGFSLKLW